MAKIQLDRCEQESEEFKRLGWLDEAEKMLKHARSWLKLVRELEDEIGELEKMLRKRPLSFDFQYSFVLLVRYCHG